MSKQTIIPAEFSCAVAEAVLASLHKDRGKFDGFPLISVDQIDGQVFVVLSIKNTSIEPLIFPEQKAMRLVRRYRYQGSLDSDFLSLITNHLNSLAWDIMIKEMMANTEAKELNTNWEATT